MNGDLNRICVVIPCYRVRDHILGVLGRIGPEVSSIYCIDDACPDESGRFIEDECDDPRVRVIHRAENGGVGAATLTGYQSALLDGAQVIVKLDGDGQMDPSLISDFATPIITGKADYAKGNRFFNLDDFSRMPALRVFGNGTLSFISKLSSGYWNIFDPTNGYTAIHSSVALHILERPVAHRYFFESDMLYHLSLLRAVVVDIPMVARYGDEVSNLKARNVIFPFLVRHAKNFTRRVFVQYFLRDFGLVSIELVLGVAALLFGLIFGVANWWESIASNESATAGTVMLAALPVIVGIQLLLNALNYDIQNIPRFPGQLSSRAKIPSDTDLPTHQSERDVSLVGTGIDRSH